MDNTVSDMRLFSFTHVLIALFNLIAQFPLFDSQR